MSMSSTNPHWAGSPAVADEVKDPSAPVASRWKKALAVFAAVAVVGGVGFAIGQATASSSDNGSSSGGPVSPVAQAQATMEAAFDDPTNEALRGNENYTGTINSTLLNDLLDEYEADPAAWEDQFLTAEIMASLSVLRASDGAGVRELAADDVYNLRQLSSAERMAHFDEMFSGSAHGRELAPALAGEGWGEIRSTTYPSPVVDGNDKVTVYRKNGKCWIVARESDDVGDWIDNLNLGSDPIMSIKKYPIRDPACGCEKQTAWWCSTYRLCDTYKQIGSGFDGFIKPMNRMRLAVWSRIQSTCTSTDVKVFSGYSRGGGLLQALVLMIRRDNLLPTNKMVLTTYGSPRALSKADSDWIHAAFPQYRNVYKSDPVPTVPYGWMGFKHFGTHYCERCSYSAGRDRPNFSLNLLGIADHISGYDTWF